jgi:hypothetical protein
MKDDTVRFAFYAIGTVTALMFMHMVGLPTLQIVGGMYVAGQCNMTVTNESFSNGCHTIVGTDPCNNNANVSRTTCFDTCKTASSWSLCEKRIAWEASKQ